MSLSAGESPASPIGTTVGRFRIDRVIGSGGMGVVFEATQLNLDRTVALKLLHPHLATSPDYLARFRREAAALARLAHPGIVHIYDVEEAGDRHFLVMELVPGPSLRQKLDREGRLAPAEVRVLGARLASALSVAHAQGVVHRDVKPANILFDSSGRPKLSDFGIARVRDERTVTDDGSLLGTPYYLSPEQVTAGSVAEASDLYSLGVVLYEALSGRPPFEGDHPWAVLRQHVHELPAPLRTRVPEVPADLAELVHALLEKVPEDRPPSASAVEARLRRSPEAAPPLVVAPGGRAPPESSFRGLADRVGRRTAALAGLRDVLPRMGQALRAKPVWVAVGGLLLFVGLGVGLLPLGDLLPFGSGKGPGGISSRPLPLAPPPDRIGDGDGVGAPGTLVDASLQLSRRFVSLRAAPGAPAEPLSVEVTTGGAGLGWTARSTEPWLWVTPTIGVDRDELELRVSAENLAPGTHLGRVIVSSPAGTEETLEVSVEVAEAASAGPNVARAEETASLGPGGPDLATDSRPIPESEPRPSGAGDPAPGTAAREAIESLVEAYVRAMESGNVDALRLHVAPGLREKFLGDILRWHALYEAVRFEVVDVRVYVNDPHRARASMTVAASGRKGQRWEPFLGERMRWRLERSHRGWVIYGAG